jgi:type VI secretion system protein ImpK
MEDRPTDRFKTRQINLEELRHEGLPAPSGRRLVDVCSDVLTLILTLANSKNYGSPKELRAGIDGLFRRMEREGLSQGFSPEDLQTAKYALVAVIDETVSRSDWTGKGEWLNNPLALEYFGENIAGTEFFNKLEDIRREARKKAGLLEVYYICLSLGFEGKYAFNPNELVPLAAQLGRELRALSPGGADLSPSWRPPEEMLRAVGRQVPVWMITAILGGGLLLVFLVIKLILNSKASGWAEQIKNL